MTFSSDLHTRSASADKGHLLLIFCFFLLNAPGVSRRAWVVVRFLKLSSLGQDCGATVACHWNAGSASIGTGYQRTLQQKVHGQFSYRIFAIYTSRPQLDQY
jgi:hypothetical protein